MKVIITSDSHGNLEVLKKIAGLHQDADLFIDAGDSERKSFEISPFLSVRGNCDLFIKNNYRIDNLNDVTLFTTHGNELFFSDKSLINKAMNFNASIAIHGHTHIPKVKVYDEMIVICPGSVSRPRGGSNCSYAIVTFNTRKDIKVEIREV